MTPSSAQNSSADQDRGVFSLLTEAERQQILVTWNATQSAYPRESCVNQLFEAQVERVPEAVAVVYADKQLTYHELNRQANQVAHYLQRLGVGPEVPVGLCMERSAEMVIGLLGILKAGGAYVPLDPTYPKERLTFMLRDAKVPVLLTQEQFVDLLAMQGMHVVCLDTEWKVITQECSENLINRAIGENLAYVMYTSGSTGRPKGVEVRHRSIIRLLFGVDYVQLDAAQTILHMAPISFDASTFEVWGALLHGARCILFPEPVPTPQSIGTAIHTHKVTILWLTASLFNAVIEEAPEALLGIKQLLIGGEALSVPHVRRALALLPSTQIINGYGPTEGTTFTCCYPIPTQVSETSRSIPIGRPIGNTQVYILDGSLKPVPIGVAGELHIGGDGLARGYLNQPELTQAKFIPHPFSNEPGARLYKSGDLARYRPDGSIEFLGRLDRQVKLRGFRIEPDEIEAVLNQHPSVRQAVVMAREDAPSDKRLVAYVALHEKQIVTVGDLQSHALKQLPNYMIPSAFVLLEVLPLTPNGKVDTRALPAPDSAGSTTKETYVAPTTMVQYQLMQIWEELLDIRPIGIRDDFFDLGGHSLLAVRLVNRIEQVCGKKLPLTTLFAGATIEYLAHALLEEEDVSSRAPLVAVQASGSKRPFFYLHGDWSAGSFYCLKLAHYLGPTQPFYVLEPYRFDGLPMPPTFEAMAAAHLEALRSVQPVGPYLLGGFCNGGLIAYEMARQLHTQGEQVELLVLIDPASPASHRWLRSILRHLGTLLHLGPQQQFAWFLHVLHVYKYLRLAQYRQRWHDLGGDSEPEESQGRSATAGLGLGRLAWLVPSVEAIRRNWLNVYEWVTADYVPGSYPGKIMVFWSSEGSASMQRMGWRQVLRRIGWTKMVEANEVEVQVIPGTHITWRTEHYRTLAEQLQMCLNKAQVATLSQ